VTDAVALVPNLDELILGLPDGSPAAELLPAFALATNQAEVRRHLRAVVDAWSADEEPAR
jgi:hypothetical protein